MSWSRAEPMSLIPAAAAMYQQGRTRSEVLAAIYGVDFPAETIPVLRDFVSGVAPVGASWRIHPWELMVPPEQRDPDNYLDTLEAKTSGSLPRRQTSCCSGASSTTVSS